MIPELAANGSSSGVLTADWSDGVSPRPGYGRAIPEAEKESSDASRELAGSTGAGGVRREGVGVRREVGVHDGSSRSSPSSRLISALVLRIRFFPMFVLGSNPFREESKHRDEGWSRRGRGSRYGDEQQNETNLWMKRTQMRYRSDGRVKMKVVPSGKEKKLVGCKLRQWIVKSTRPRDLMRVDDAILARTGHPPRRHINRPSTFDDSSFQSQIDMSMFLRHISTPWNRFDIAGIY